MEGQTRVLSLTQGSEKTHLLIQCQNTNYNVEIAKAVRCDCFCQQMAGKKTCCHIIWCLMNVYCLDKNDQRLAQVEFANDVFHDLVLKTPSEIPEHLKTFSSIKARVFCKQLEAHDKFNSEQEWLLIRKTMSKPARCSGCLKPGAIKMTDLHLRMKGLLFLERDNRVAETNLRFCLNKSCCLNIESSRNNTQPLKSPVIKRTLCWEHYRKKK